MAPCPRPTLLWHPARWVPALESSPVPQVCCWARPGAGPPAAGMPRQGILHRVIPGHGQRSAAPRGTEGDPCSATFVGGFQTRAKGTGFLLLCKWENILQRKPSLLSQAHQLCSFRRCLL